MTFNFRETLKKKKLMENGPTHTDTSTKADVGQSLIEANYKV